MNKIKTTITIIIVLYKKDIHKCVSYKTLMDNIDCLHLDFQLIVYNNSPEHKIEDTENTIVINSEKDGKLPEAYNYALNFSIQNNANWLLLLDQDTEITKDYLIELENRLNSTQVDDLVAIVPKLIDNDTVLSPKIISNFGWWENNIKCTGYQTGRVVAFNSLSLLNVKFLQNIGGFPDKYPLDMLDHWYYNQIYLHNKKVFVIDSLIKHSLSFQNYEQDVSINRHIDFLDAEKEFVKELKLSHFVIYKLKLLLRTIKQFIIFRNKEYAKFTFRKFLSR